MNDVPSIRSLLKRGALITAANWPVVLVQAAAEASLKVLLAIPVAGGALLVRAAAGGDVREFLEGDLRLAVTRTVNALTVAPGALTAFLGAFALVLVGGSVLVFLVKGGTMTVLTDAERAAGRVERPPLRLAALVTIRRFGIVQFLAGCGHLARRYVTLGLALLAIYGITAAAYLTMAVTAYQRPGALLGWTIAAALATAVLLVWLLFVNLLYILTQIVLATDDCGVRSAVRRVAGFLRACPGDVGGILGVLVALVVLATTASLLAAAGLGLIAFVPVVGVIVIPLQLAAWVLRGVFFQYLSLTAMVAYLARYRIHGHELNVEDTSSASAADATVCPKDRIA